MRNVVITLFLICSFKCIAQSPVEAITRLADSLPAENVYIHTDKKSYVAGETIWFKAYLCSLFAPSDQSRNFYITLSDTRSTILFSKKIPVIDGTARGDFTIDASMPEGIYMLHAYTPRMLNREQLYIKAIPIYNPNKPFVQPVSSKSPGYNFLFYPESGKIINDLQNFIGFKAVNRYQRPVSIDGTLVNSKDGDILKFSSNRGTGLFNFTPVAGEKYYAKVNFPEGTVKQYELPERSESGVLLHLFDSSGNKRFVITSKGGYYENKDLLLLGVLEDNVVFQEKITLKQNLIKGIIPVKGLPSGLLQVFVFDKNNLLAERITFIKNDDWAAPVSFSADTINLSSKGKNVFSFTLPDSVYASLSLSITDAGSELTRLDNEDIVSGLQYSSVERNNSFTIPGERDELTGNWKRINWDQLLKNKYPAIKFNDESYVNIKGKVYKEGTKKPVTGGELTFFMRTKGSLTQIFNAGIDKNGEFALMNMVFEDTATFNYQLNTQKNSKQKVDIELGPLEKTSPPVPLLPIIPADEIPDYVFNDSKSKEKARDIYDSTMKLFQRSITLAEVKVIARKKTPLQIVNETYTTGLFSDLSRSKVADFINDPPPPSSMNIYEYLQGRFAGLIVERRGGTYFAWSPRAQSLTGGQIEAAVFVNEMQVDASTAAMVSMHDIALVKYFPPSALLTLGVGIAPVIAIFTKKGSEDVFRSPGNLNNFKFPGYSATKEFNAPDYSEADNNKSDNRTTILWQPNVFIIPGENKYVARFYNSDNAKKLKIVLEGFTTDGKLIHFEKTIE